MPKTFIAPEQSRMLVQQQRQAGHLNFLAGTLQEADEDEDDDAFPASGRQAWMDEPGPLNLPINGIAPGTSASFFYPPPAAEHDADGSAATGDAFHDEYDLFDDEASQPLFDAGVHKPQWSPFAIYPQPDAPRDEIFSLLRELNAVNHLQQKKRPASDSFGQFMRDSVDAGWMLGSGKNPDADAHRHERMVSLQATLDRHHPDYENILHEKAVREIGLHIQTLKRWLRDQPTASPVAPNVVLARQNLAELKRAQAIAKNLHVAHLRQASAATGVPSYDLSSARHIIAYLIYAADSTASLLGLPGHPDIKAFDLKYPLEHALEASSDTGYAFSLQEMRQYASNTVDLLPEQYFAGERGSPANTTDSRNMLKAMVCEQLEQDWTRPTDNEAAAPAASMSLPSYRAGIAPVPLGAIAGAYAGYTLVGVQQPSTSWTRTLRAVVGNAIIPVAAYAILGNLYGWWPFRGNVARPEAENSTVPPSSALGNATTPTTTNATTPATTEATSAASLPSQSTSQATTTGNYAWVTSSTTDSQMEQADAPAQDLELETFRTELGENLTATLSVLTFVHDQLHELTSSKSLGLSTQQTLAQSLPEQAQPLPGPILKNFLALFGIDIPDLDEKLALTNIAPYNRSLDVIDAFIQETHLFRQRVPEATIEQLSALKQEISGIDALPKSPPVRNRDMWKALTNGRNILALFDLQDSARYSDFISGYHAHMTIGQQSVESALLSIEFLHHAAADFRRVFGVSPEATHHAAAVKFQAWAQDVKALYSSLAQGPLQTQLAQYKAQIQADIANPQRKQQLDQIIATESMRGLARDLREKLQTLPTTLLLDSQLEQLKMRSEQRMNAMQAGRAVTSLPALGGLGNRIIGAVYANTTTDRITGSLGAFEELFAAIKVPWEIAWTAHDTAKQSGTSFGTEFRKKTWDPLKVQWQTEIRQRHHKISVDRNMIELRTLSGQRGYEIPLTKLTDDSKKISKSLSQMAQRDPLALRREDALVKQFRNQLPFLGQDIISLIINAYSYSQKGQMSAAEQAEMSLKITTSLAYLGGTTIGTFMQGHRQVLASRSLNAVGIATGIGTGIANIVKISERTDENRNRDMGLATAQLISDTSAMIGAIALPAIGTLLTLALPNFNAIGFAMDYHQASLALAAQGMASEATMARAMRDMAIADSIPIVNWFGFIYQPIVMQQNTLAEEVIDETVAKNIIAQLKAMQPHIAANLPTTVGGAQVYPMLVTPVTLSVNYWRVNSWVLTPKFPDARINETQKVTLWAAFGREPGRVHVFPQEIRHSVWRNGWLTSDRESYPGLENSPMLKARAYENRTVLSREQVNEEIPEFTIVDGRSDTIDTAGMTLYLRNTKVARPTIYVVADQGNGKLRMHSNDERSTFIVSKEPQYVNGRSGRNTVEFFPESTESEIDLDRFVNISTVYGPPSARQVSGSVPNMTYVSSAGNPHERIQLRGNNNTVIATNGSHIEMGPGDDRVIAQGIPRDVRGGPGIDLLSFEISSLQGINLDGNGLSTIPQTDELGTLEGFEFVQLTKGADNVESITANTGITVLDTADGDDTVAMDGISDFTLFLGSGTDTATIDAPLPFNNHRIYGEGGAKTISMQLRGQGNSIFTRADSNRIKLRGMSGADNSVALALGGIDNDVTIEGNLALDYHISAGNGAGVIHDDAQRTAPLHIFFRSPLTMDDVQATVFLPIEAATSIQVRFFLKNAGDGAVTDVLTIHTWPGVPILCTTGGDGKTFHPG